MTNSVGPDQMAEANYTVCKGSGCREQQAKG